MSKRMQAVGLRALTTKPSTTTTTSSGLVIEKPTDDNLVKVEIVSVPNHEDFKEITEGDTALIVNGCATVKYDGVEYYRVAIGDIVSILK